MRNALFPWITILWWWQQSVLIMNSNTKSRSITQTSILSRHSEHHIVHRFHLLKEISPRLSDRLQSGFSVPSNWGRATIGGGVGVGIGVGVPSSSSWDSLHFALVLDPSSWSCVFFLGLLPCFGKTSLLVSSSWKHVGNTSFETLPFKSILIQSSYIIDGVPMHRILR